MATAELDPAPPGPRPALPDAGDDRTPPPWRAWTAPAALVLALVVASMLAAVVGVIALAGSRDGGSTNVADLVATLLQDLCFVGAALFFAQLVSRPRPWQFGLRPTRVWPAVGLVVAGYLAFFAITAAWLSALGLHESENLPHELGADDGTAALGAVHAVSSPVGFLVPLALFGFGLCLIYAWTRSLYPCIALHALNNALAFGSSEHWSWQIPVVVAGALVAIGCVLATIRVRLG